MKWSTMLGAAILVAAPPTLAETLNGPYRADVVRIIDGDTIEARIRIWLGTDLVTLVRLRGIDTPERHGPCAEAADQAREILAALLRHHPITLTHITHDKYGGRITAVVHLPGGEDVAEELIRRGAAKRWGEGRC